VNKIKKPPLLESATTSEQRGVRYLHLGSLWVQGAMRIKQPHRLELEYIRRMMVWLLCHEAGFWLDKHALQLGLGAGAITRFCYHNLGMQTTAVEINPSVIAACRSGFHLPVNDARLNVICADALDFVSDSAKTQTVHTLHVDLYDHEAKGPVFDDEAFYAHCYRLLKPGGTMTVNLFGRHASFERSATHIAKSFDQVWHVAPTKEGNTVVLAMRKIDFPAADVLALRAKNLETAFELPATQWLGMIKPLSLA
jgi:spermidine synthase